MCVVGTEHTEPQRHRRDVDCCWSVCLWTPSGGEGEALWHLQSSTYYNVNILLFGLKRD